MSGMPAPTGTFFSGASATTASVVRMFFAIDAAFCSAERVTIVGSPIPHAEIEALVHQYLGPGKRAGQGAAPIRTHRFEDVLVRTRFGAPRFVFAPGVPDVVRDTEGVLSGYFSFSWSAPHLFGDRVDEFAGDVRELLASRSPAGVFWDWPGDTEIIVARKPA